METKPTTTARWALPACADVLFIGLSGSGKSLLRRQLLKLAKLHAGDTGSRDSRRQQQQRKSATQPPNEPGCSCWSFFRGRRRKANSIHDESGADADESERQQQLNDIHNHGDSTQIRTANGGYSCFRSLLPKLANPMVSGLYPTLGVELDEVNVPPPANGAEGQRVRVRRRGSSRPGRFMRLREVGGLMRPIWSSYYSDCSMLIFVIDASVDDDLVEAGTALRASLTDFRAVNASAHVLIVLNKVDHASASPSRIAGGEGSEHSLRHALMMTDDMDASSDHNETTTSPSMTDGNARTNGDGNAPLSPSAIPPLEDMPSSSAIDSRESTNGDDDGKWSGDGETHFEILKASALTGQGLDTILDWIVGS